MRTTATPMTHQAQRGKFGICVSLLVLPDAAAYEAAYSAPVIAPA